LIKRREHTQTGGSLAQEKKMSSGSFFILFTWLLAHVTQSTLAVDYRLSKDIVPELYDIHIKPYLQREDGSKQFTFEGQVNITLHASVKNLSVITLHKDRINILDARLYDALGNTREVIKQEFMEYDNVTDKLSLHLSSSLEAFTAYILYFKYEGEIRNGMAGFYRGTYDNDNWYGMTQLHRIDARTAFPCFDEPEFKAKFQMHISRPKQQKAYFNTRLIKSTADGTERVIDHFEATPLMSTYLVAFVISDFESHGNEDLRIIMHKQFKNKTNCAFEVALKALEAYDNYTGMPYKTMGNSLMQKVGSNHFPHGGMENWGLIIYKDSVLALEPGYSDGWSNKQTTVSLVVHEIGHMWFGNSVTHKWWSYFWLNEAFPNYYQYFLGQELYPEYEFDKQFLIKEMHKVFDIDASSLAQPMSSLESSINTPPEIASQFSDFAYAKGASIVRMFANLMGKENFDLAIREYLKENHLKAVEPENLFKFLKKYWPSDHNVDLNEFFKDWTEQVGYPMVMVSVTSSGRFAVKQKRFLLDPADGSDTSLRYTIPITFNNDMKNDFNDLKPKFYLTKDQEERQFGNALHHKWMLVNAQQSNYYRVFYDSQILKELRQVLMEFNHTGIPVNNRASLVDDVFTYGRIGLKDYEEVLSFMEYLATETEYSPWQAAFKGLDHISKRLTMAQQDKFKHYLYDIMAKVYEKLGFENPNVTILDIYNRNQVITWLCKYDHEDCNTKAQTLFRSHFKSNTKTSPDFRETLYCAANRNDKSEVYANLREMFTQQQPLSEKEKLLKAMGCSRYHVKHHYEFLLSENVAKEMKVMGLNSLYSQTAENIVPVFHLMIENVEQLAESLDSWPTTAKVISDIANYLTTQEELALLKEFIEVKGHLFGTSVTILENAIQTTENNFKWSYTHLGKFIDYLTLRNVDYRLNKDVMPLFYDIHLKPYLRQEDGPKQFTFEGEVNIAIKANKEDIKKIILHKDLMDIVECKLYNSKGLIKEHISSGNMLFEAVTSKLTLYLAEALEINTNYTLYFKYHGQIRNGTEGIFKASYDNINWYALTQLHRIDARTAFPCFDEPEFKAKFQMHISRPKIYNSVFNTRLLHTTNDGPDRAIDHFEVTPLMSTYLVAFLVSDFESYGTEDLRIIMHSQYANKTNLAFEVGLKALEAYDNYTGMPYKTMGNTIMQKVGSPNFPHSGMENWGLVIYKDSILANEPGYTDGWLDKQTTIGLVVHETAHMWFGNSVTHKWWSYFWLNEAFARYYQYFMAQQLYPEYEFDQQFMNKQLQMIFDLDATNQTQPLTSLEEKVNTPIEIGNKFSSIAYAKGAAVVYMFRNLMGQSNFDKAIKDYLKENHLSTSEPEDLFKHLKSNWPKGHNVDLDEFFKDWTEQEGYPMLNVSVINSRYVLRQQRFLLDPLDGSDNSIKYTIPVTFTHDRMADFTNLTPKFYLNKAQNEKVFGNAQPHKWTMFNVQQAFYYRVYYDNYLLQRLKQAFKAEQHSRIHVYNRASLIDDLFAFAQTGLRNYDEVLQFMEYLATETEYLPWQAAFKGFEFLTKHFNVVHHDKFKHYLYDIMAKVYEKLGFENSNVTILDIYNRNQVITWLCKYDHEDCNTKAQTLFRSHFKSNTKPSPDFRETLYCAANRNDKSEVYANLREMFTQQQPLSEKEKLLKAMGCSRYRVKDHYEFLLSENVAKEMKVMALNSLYSQTAENIVPVFHLMIENVEQLAESLDSWPSTAKVISDIANYLTTQEELAMLKEFIEVKGHLFGTSVTILENAIKTVENNLKWSLIHMDKMMSYLLQHYHNITYRLEKDIVPEFYDIYLKPYLQDQDGLKQFTFEGEVNITLKAVKENIRKITLHKDYIDISQVMLYDDAGNMVENINSGSWLYETATDKLTLYLMNALAKETKYVLYLKYQGQIRNGLAGVFRATYDNVNWYGITQLQRIDARTAFPCFDEPEFKAKFRMRINRPKEYNSHFNTRLTETISDKNGRYIDYFEETPFMSTYLVAFLISDFDAFGYKDFKIIMHEKFKGKTNFAYEAGLKILNGLDNYTQIPYKSLGNEIMQKAGSTRFPHNGMENWGLVIYHDSVLAQEPDYTDGWSDKQYTVTILTHETSHMWFGNSVTFKWWSYFWLNEAFARYYQYFLAHELYPEYELDKQFVINQVQLIFGTDATNNTQPLTSPEEIINTPSEIAYKFSGITYAKGAAIVRMFANLMGKENFDAAIREYLKDNHLRNVVPEDLFKYLKKYWPQEHKVDLDQLFKDWTEQEGYPMVTVSATADGKYSLKQQRFLLNPQDGSNTSLRYTIPITFNNDKMTNFSNLTPKFYFNKTQDEVLFGNPSHHTWLLLNTQQSNYYRVFYDDFLLNQLKSAFRATNYSGIDVSSRSSVIDDLFTYGSVGLRGYDEIFEFMEYLKEETEYLPWYAAFKGINTVYQRMTFEEHRQFAPFLYELLDKVYKKLGFEKSDVTVLDIYNRNKVISWLCRYQHEDCNKQALNIFHRHVESQTKPSTDFRETLYCSAVRLDQKAYYKLKEIFINETLSTEKEKILRALGCTKLNVQEQYEFILTPEVPQDLKTFGLQSLYSQTPENVQTVFELFTNNVEQLAEALQSWSLTANVISGLADYLTTAQQLQQLKQFTYDKGHLFGSSVKVLENSIERTANNLQWADKHLAKLFKYLSQRNAAVSLNSALMGVPISMLILHMLM
ncbi:hypothetical protein DOY81_006271, partial [Sarcophaga bullata]